MGEEDDDPEAAGIDPEILARAEQAVAALSDSFADTTRRELAEMNRLIDRLADGEDASIDPLFDRAHDLAGQGGSFGFPLISRVGQSICEYIKTRGPTFTGEDIAALHTHTETALRILDGNLTEGDDAEAQIARLEALGGA